MHVQLVAIEWMDSNCFLANNLGFLTHTIARSLARSIVHMCSNARSPNIKCKNFKIHTHSEHSLRNREKTIQTNCIGFFYDFWFFILWICVFRLTKGILFATNRHTHFGYTTKYVYTKVIPIHNLPQRIIQENLTRIYS